MGRAFYVVIHSSLHLWIKLGLSACSGAAVVEAADETHLEAAQVVQRWCAPECLCNAVPWAHPLQGPLGRTQGRGGPRQAGIGVLGDLQQRGPQHRRHGLLWLVALPALPGTVHTSPAGAAGMSVLALGRVSGRVDVLDPQTGAMRGHVAAPVCPRTAQADAAVRGLSVLWDAAGAPALLSCTAAGAVRMHAAEHANDVVQLRDGGDAGDAGPSCAWMERASWAVSTNVLCTVSHAEWCQAPAACRPTCCAR